ncbi:MAG TPA: LysR family transcriptional regulator [Solirubrobacteraceae bacterium]|jgi:molybdate transport repressor ModE-like protein
MEGSNAWAGVELRHLLALEAIAEIGSFNRAAEELGYTQSAVSQQIAALERIVGERLLERPNGSRPVRLTDAGSLLLRHARSMFAQMGAAQADLGALRAGTEAPLRVGVFQSVSPGVLPEVLARLARRVPPLTIDPTHTTSDEELFDGLRRGTLDVVFAVRPVPPGPFAVRDLFADPFVVLAPAGHELARRGRRVSLSELAGLPLITWRTCRCLPEIEALIAAAGEPPDVTHRSDDNGTLVGLVAAGEGVALVSRVVADATPADVVALEIDEYVPPRRFALAWRDDRLLPQAREAFAAVVAEACSALGLADRAPGVLPGPRRVSEAA